MRRYEVVISPVDTEPFLFFIGDLEPAEVGSIVVAVFKRMAGGPVGWSLHIRELTKEGEP